MDQQQAEAYLHSIFESVWINCDIDKIDDFYTRDVELSAHYTQTYTENGTQKNKSMMAMCHLKEGKIKKLWAYADQHAEYLDSIKK